MTSSTSCFNSWRRFTSSRSTCRRITFSPLSILRSCWLFIGSILWQRGTNGAANIVALTKLPQAVQDVLVARRNIERTGRNDPNDPDQHPNLEAWSEETE